MKLKEQTRTTRRPEAERPRVVVFGSRRFYDRELLFKTLDHLLRKLTDPIIVSGHAEGADELGEEWAFHRHHTYKIFHADWDKHGKAAGPVRNQEMADYAAERLPSYAVAFWNGESSGTKDMIARCRKAGLTVRVILYNKEKKKSLFG